MEEMIYKVVPARIDDEGENPPPVIFPDSDWLEEAYGKCLCRHCCSVLISRYPQSFDIVVDMAPDENVVGAPVETIGIIMWHRQFLEELKDHLQKFVFGRCFLSNGAELTDYAFIYSNHFTFVRGNKQARYSICPECGAIRSNPRPGPEYILQSELQYGSVLQDLTGSLYLTDQLAGKFNYTEWMVGEYEIDLIELHRISLREQPADGRTFE